VLRIEMNDRVRQFREARGISQRGPAREAGITPTTARRAERGQPVRVSTARKIGGALQVDPRSLGTVVRTEQS
jgi:transcriptional regulator with XRE-family HTH domain